METTEMIKVLRDAVNADPGKVCFATYKPFLSDVADRLEELDERVAIMEEGNGLKNKMKEIEWLCE